MTVALRWKNPEGICFFITLIDKEISATDVIARAAKTLSLAGSFAVKNIGTYTVFG